MPRKRPSEDPANGAGSDPPSEGMERFKRLTKGLLGVSSEELAEQERRYQASRPARREAP